MASPSSIPIAGSRTGTPPRCARGPRRRTRAPTHGSARYRRGARSARASQQLLGIGVLGTPTPARGRYLYQRRDGSTNQPILYVRDGLEGNDRVALDPNRFRPRAPRRSTGIMSVPTAGCSPTDSPPTAASRACCTCSTSTPCHRSPTRSPTPAAATSRGCPTASGFYYTRYPAPGAVAAGEEQYHRAVWFHRLGDDPAIDRLVFQPAGKEYWPGVSLSDDGRWLLIGVARTFDETDLYLQDLASGGELVPVAVDLPATFDGQVAHGVLYLRTNLDAPTFRLYAVDPAAPGREHWREIVPARTDAVLSSVGVTAGHLVLDYLERATARLRLAGLDGSSVREVQLPTLGSLFGLGMEPDGHEVLFGFSSFTRAAQRVPPGSGRRACRASGAGSKPTSTRSASP